MSISRVKYIDALDVELRVISGEGWSIPLMCEHCMFEGRRSYHIRAGVGLNYDQADLLDGVLNGINGVRATHGWIVPMEGLAGIAKKAQGITPARYFTWDGNPQWTHRERKEPEVENKIKFERSDETDDFLEHVCMTSGIRDKGVVQLIWTAIMQQIPEWLMSGKKLNLGAFSIIALPFRKNWLRLLLSQIPGLGRILLHKDDDRAAGLAMANVPRHMRHTELTEAHYRDGVVIHNWTIEVTNTGTWEKLVEENELSAALRAGPLGYMRRWAAFIQAQEHEILEIASDTFEKEGKASCRILWPRGEDSYRFVTGAPTILRPEHRTDLDGGGANSFDDIAAQQGWLKHLEEKTADVLRMPPEEPQVDMRDGGERHVSGGSS